MYKASLGILGLFFILDTLKRYSTNTSYTITISIVQMFFLLAGAYCLWYDYKQRKLLKKHLRLLRERRAELVHKEQTRLIQTELHLNSAHRIKILTQLNNPKYYNRHIGRLHANIQSCTAEYLFVKLIS